MGQGHSSAYLNMTGAGSPGGWGRGTLLVPREETPSCSLNTIFSVCTAHCGSGCSNPSSPVHWCETMGKYFLLIPWILAAKRG